MRVNVRRLEAAELLVMLRIQQHLHDMPEEPIRQRRIEDDVRPTSVLAAIENLEAIKLIEHPLTTQGRPMPEHWDFTQMGVAYMNDRREIEETIAAAEAQIGETKHNAVREQRKRVCGQVRERLQALWQPAPPPPSPPHTPPTSPVPPPPSDPPA